MPKAARDRLAQLLSGAQSAGADSAVLRLPGDALALDVAGLGAIRTPIRAVQAKQLIGVARPARYGRGEETLSDISVRDTWELPPDQVSLGGPSWQGYLDAALEHFAEKLGLPAGTRLTAELHSLLVYGKGQFFLPHQDSEKHDAMVASLVVMLPSVHTGGELVVDDAGSEQTYGGSRDELVLVAFYADRRHEVRPVRSGYRVSLTFNLLMTAPSTTSAAGPVEVASSYLTEHFTTRVSSRYGGRDPGKPTRLAFLLDHEYTEGGLAAGRLKGADAERVATLRSAAEQAGCQSVLALAEIKETWDVLPDQESWDRHWYEDDEVDEDDEPDDVEPGHDDDDYDLNSLIDDEITLGWWTSPDGSRAEKIRLPLSDHEVCTVTPTVSLTPYETEFEGYMGNYGNTLDRWYRRAAVVVWPTEKSFAARAEAGSVWALETLLDRIDAGDLVGARTDAASLEPFWRDIDAALLAPSLRVAAGLGDTGSARVVAGPFRMEMLTADHAPLLAALAREYGEPWLLDVLGRWDSANRFAGTDRLAWIAESLLPLCQELREHGADPIADGCAGPVWRWLWNRIEQSIGQAHPERRRMSSAELGVPLARLLEAASDELGTAIAEALRTLDDDVVGLLVPALRAHRPPSNQAVVAVAQDCRIRLDRLVDRPARAEGDWSITWTGCGCAVCDRLAEFLNSRSERTREWPLAKPGRLHVHQQIDGAGLPVRHTTRRQGRPYTLLLTKTEDVFRREDDARQQARTDLAWLTSAFA